VAPASRRSQFLNAARKSRWGSASGLRDADGVRRRLRTPQGKERLQSAD
jgi:hypothetical protein